MKVHLTEGVAKNHPGAAKEIAEAGHELVPGGTLSDVCIHHATDVDLSGSVSAAKRAGASVLVIGSAAELRDLPAEVDEIAVSPIEEGELDARLTHMSRRRKRTTQAKLLETAIESAGDIVEITDPESRYMYVNRAFSRVFGIPKEEAVGKTPGQLIRSDMHDAAFWQEIEATLASGRQWTGVVISRTLDGRYVHLETTLSPVYDGNGIQTHHVGVKRDVTRRILAEEELRLANVELVRTRDAALAADRAKSQFLANMSHELRTPLNAIIGYSEILEEDANDAGMGDFVADLRKIRASGRHLLGLINDVLDLSKIEAGKMELFIEEFDIRPTLAAISETVKPLFEQRSNTLTLELSDDLGEMRSDLTKLRQTLLNLLSNANKFTERGTVVLRGHADGDFIQIDVADSGIGMTEAQMAHLFQPFVQAESDTTRRYGGTGLGLTISRRFCEMMGGTVEVSSKLGKGSTFTVRLPRTSPEPKRHATSVVPEPEHVVLVVDDDPAARELIARALAALAVRVEGVSKGQEALERAREAEPDAIVLDVMMPGMDGWAVLKELKDHEETRDIPVIMHTVSHEREMGFALGAVDFIIKPVEPRRLARVIASHFRGGGPVLVVDDDPDARELMRRALDSAGHEVIEASGGAEALILIDSRAPRLIVLDLMMPEVDGFDVLEHLRSRHRLQQIPVIVVTAKSLTPEERLFLQGATRRVIEKTGFNRDELLEAVRDRVTEALEQRGR
jgi:PAS domain S-box-containing protein